MDTEGERKRRREEEGKGEKGVGREKERGRLGGRERRCCFTHRGRGKGGTYTNTPFLAENG